MSSLRRDIWLGKGAHIQLYHFWEDTSVRTEDIHLCGIYAHFRDDISMQFCTVMDILVISSSFLAHKERLPRYFRIYERSKSKVPLHKQETKRNYLHRTCAFNSQG